MIQGLYVSFAFLSWAKKDEFYTRSLKISLFSF